MTLRDDYVTDKTVELHNLKDIFISVSNLSPFRLASDKFLESHRPRENLVCSRVEVKLKELKILVLAPRSPITAQSRASVVK